MRDDGPWLTGLACQGVTSDQSRIYSEAEQRDVLGVKKSDIGNNLITSI